MIWGLLLLLCLLQHQQILLLVHQMVQDGFPLVVSSCLLLLSHEILFSLSRFYHQLRLIPAKNGLKRVGLRYRQPGESVLYLKQGHT